MNAFKTTLLCACLAVSAGTAGAQEAMKKQATETKEGTMRKEMTMQECKDHMAMGKKDGMKKDDAMMKKEAACAEMMKSGASAPMKK